MAEGTGSKLPSIQHLAKDSWELFKKTWVAYLKIVGLAAGYLFVGVIITVLISLPVTFVALGSHFQFSNNMTPFQIADGILLVFWFIFFLLSLIAIQVIFPVVGIFILQGKKTSPVLDLIKQAKPIFWTYLFTVLLAVLLTAGGLILFVIPGLLIAFFFAFVMYEVVIEGKSGRVALERSYFMVKNNFWEVLLRLVVLEVAVLVVSSVLHRIAAGDAFLALVSFLFSLFASWYARAYTFLLYKEVRARTTFPHTISMQWLWTVACIGWIIILLLLLVVVTGNSHYVFPL